MNFLAIHLESLTSGLIHEDAVYRILLAGSQVLVGHHIINSDRAVDGNFLFFPDGGLGADFRHMDGDGLTFVLNIRMDSQFPAIQIQILEHHDICIGLDIFRVELKNNGYCTAGILRDECGFRAHLLTADFQRFPGSLVHKHALDGVLFARHQIGVLYYIF